MTLSDELRAIAADYPLWHLYLSDAGNVWATNVQNPYVAGGGITVTAHTPELMRYEIACAERERGLWKSPPGPVFETRPAAGGW